MNEKNATIYQLDEDTQELCIGDACFMVRLNPETGDVTVEVDPESDVCDVQTQQLARRILEKMVAGESQITFRRKAKTA
jgi:hypothetical protein